MGKDKTVVDKALDKAANVVFGKGHRNDPDRELRDMTRKQDGR